ncbi:hypothetical protein GQ457_08G000980 [Hibiscus cannabinus]
MNFHFSLCERLQMAMAAKAKLLFRELKIVRTDLAFAKERCAQLEEENTNLPENGERGNNPENDRVGVFPSSLYFPRLRNRMKYWLIGLCNVEVERPVGGKQNVASIFINLVAQKPSMAYVSCHQSTVSLRQKGVLARSVLFRPGGPLACELARHAVALKVNDWIFCHGGLLPHHVAYGIEKMNMEVSQWMRGVTDAGSSPHMPFIATKGYDSVVWNRLYSRDISELEDYKINQINAILKETLQAVGAKAMVVGHTPQYSGANCEYNCSIWRIDVGMSSGVLNSRPEVLEIRDDKAKIEEVNIEDVYCFNFQQRSLISSLIESSSRNMLNKKKRRFWHSRQIKMEEYYDKIIQDLIEYDKKDAFVGRIHHEAQSVGGYDVYQSLMLPRIVAYIVQESAVKCATALFQGQTGLKPDINAVDPDAGFAPLHCASDDPELVELFLRYGARTDIRCQGCLPLDCALATISDQTPFIGWSTRQSIYMTIVFMCLQDQAESLECVRLLFRATKEVEKEIYRYVKDGKIIEILALLMVAREEVTSPFLFKGDGSMSLHQLVLSEIVSLMASQITLVSTSEEVHYELNNKLETMMSMLLLVQVFERVGDKIDLFRRYLTKWCDKLLAAQIAGLLINEGLAEYKDFELKSDYRSASTRFFSDFNRGFLEVLEWKLYESMHWESGTTKIYKLHHVDALLRKKKLSTHPPTLEPIPILNNENDAKGSSPLKASLEKLCHHPYLNDWTPKKSTFKLVCILCLPQLKESLENIRLVACKTEEIEAIGCDLTRQGKLIELASLLMVAPEKLLVTTLQGNNDLRSIGIRRCIMSDLQALVDSEVRLKGSSNSHKLVEKEMKLSALLLLEVFERAGHSINHYLQSDTYNEGRRSRLEITGEILNLLEKAGFAMKPKDTDLNDIKCFSITLDPVDYSSLPSALRPREFSVAERGLRPMVQGNSKCCSPWVSAPASKVLKPGIPNVAEKNVRRFLSLGLAMIKRV